MNLSDFDFHLPEALIAQRPTQNRVDSRLLHVDAQGKLRDYIFSDIHRLLHPGDLLVRNNVKVIKARMFGRKQTGGQLEFMLERVLDHERLLTQIRASRAPSSGDKIFIEEYEATVLSRDQGLYELSLSLGEGESIEDFIDTNGHLPLPPYIQRGGEDLDEERYQTVFAKTAGAVAAPTAGLHFDQALFSRLKQKGVEIAETTLFVGSGTFQPVRVDDIRQHSMHSEQYQVDAELVEKVQACKGAGGRVVALGTTSLRALESASLSGQLETSEGETNIFIYPGFQFRCVDALITNFHLPKSTLLMLVSAFSGSENIRKAYQHAIQSEYRFFSYGDAMFLERKAI